MSERDEAPVPGGPIDLSNLPPEFAGFDRLYEQEIRPNLIAREAERVAAAQKAVQTRWIGGAIIVGGALLGLLVLKMPVVSILVAIAGFGVIGWGNMGIMKLAGEAKALIVEPIARQLNLSFTAAPGTCESIFRHKEVGVVPGWDRSKFEDLLTGRRGAVDFELFEAHLEERRTTTDSKGRTRTTWVTVFRGQCVRFDFHKTFYGRTLVTRDAGFFNRFGGGKGLQRAALEDPRFEKIFEVYTTDQVESRYLLTPDLMQKLVDLETTFKGGKLKTAFDGGEMLITVQGGNLFEPGSMFKPLDSADRVHELLNDFAAVFRLIDAVTAGRSRMPPPAAPTP
ncbi:MAG: DUF3137 domain-containing protein [Acidobacteria bacterium]|jgi:hypothetical protein|nr:DUF3137 domain-containing protein [Acidobacteriota bacterium]